MDEIIEAEWSWLEEHAKRDALIIVSQELALREVADAVAADKKKQVAEWVEGGLVGKPTANQIKLWGTTPQKRFCVLIVQPFVLAQEGLVH